MNGLEDMEAMEALLDRIGHFKRGWLKVEEDQKARLGLELRAVETQSAPAQLAGSLIQRDAEKKQKGEPTEDDLQTFRNKAVKYPNLGQKDLNNFEMPCDLAQPNLLHGLLG